MTWVDSIMSRIRAGAEVGMRQALELAREESERLQSVPVVRTRGRVIRSRPGQPPRRETGRLQASHRTQIEGEGDAVRGVLFNVARSERGAPYPAYLERGTSRMAARPTYGPVGRAVSPIAAELVSRAVAAATR